MDAEQKTLMQVAYLYGWEDEKGNIVVMPTQKQVADRFGVPVGIVKQAGQPRYEGEPSWSQLRRNERKLRKLDRLSVTLDDFLERFNVIVEEVEQAVMNRVNDGTIIPTVSELARLKELQHKAISAKEGVSLQGYSSQILNLIQIKNGPYQRGTLDGEVIEVGTSND